MVNTKKTKKNPPEKDKLIINLLDPELLKSVNEELGDIVVQDDFIRARKLAKNLATLLSDGKFEKNQPEVYVEYQKIINTAKWLSLNIYLEKEVKDLFETDIANPINDPDIILWDKIKSLLLANYLVEDRDKVKREFREALLRNNQILTKTGLAKEGKEEKGTVSNWLRDYTGKFGAGPLQERSVELYNYLSFGDNMKKLSPEEKKSVIKLFDIFERLKHSSLTLAGYEGSIGVADEKNDKFGVISDGEAITIDKKVTEHIRQSEIIRQVALGKKPKSALREVINSAALLEDEDEKEEPSTGVLFGGGDLEAPQTEKQVSETEREVLEAYQGDKKLQKAIAKEIEKLDKKFSGNKEGLRDEFFQTTQKGNINRTVGALMLMTQNGELLEFIGEDPKLNKFLEAIWEKQYGADLVADFKINPSDIKYVKLFLQYVLEQRLKMDENDAARVGLQIGNAFAALGKKSYNKMAYFDVKTKKFNWFE